MTGQTGLSLSFIPLDEAAAREIIRWKYDPPYDIYNYRPEEKEKDIRYLVDPANCIYGIHSRRGELIGFCSYGKDAQVPGGTYGADALDIGLGMRPDLTGRGLGSGVILEVLGFAGRINRCGRFRVTIASINIRARRAWEKAGFSETQSFHRVGDGSEFVILVKEA
jgi:ribosomal-protein-alanine N-acetyltransferase